jgi:hypothetical protein
MQQKTMRVKSWDPTTQKFKYDVVKIEGYRFNDDDRMKICSEFLSSGLSATTIAERANGIIKREWLYKMTIATIDECGVILERIINFYNTERPHMSIGWQTPAQAHRQSGVQKKCWKASYAMG